MATDALAIQPNKLIELAIQQNANPDVLAKLLLVQERWEANEARKAYVTAMNAFKANPPKITKNKQVAFNQTKYMHATLDNVCDVIGSAMSKHGLSYRWETDQSEGHIRVTCIVTHELGHSERTTLVCDPDNTGNKNSIQAIGSAVTYLQRYTLLALTGMATEDQDTDGTVETIDISEALEFIANSRNRDELMKFYLPAYKKAQDAKDKAAMQRLLSAKNRRTAELS